MQEGILKTIDMLGLTIEEQARQLATSQSRMQQMQSRIDELEREKAGLADRPPQNDVLSGPRDSA